ncbi:hypothetical protein [Paenarthrobacter nitroguajacolicus]|uniref:hypothetical protein n=1 Tax=Paenarthrobacter nitroguajacolicus TaxID=211146 RepID=UPI0040546E10
MTGNYVGANGDDSLLADFYGVYGRQNGKPVAIPETAALFASGAAGESGMAIMEAWLNQLFSSSNP